MIESIKSLPVKKQWVERVRKARRTFYPSSRLEQGVTSFTACLKGKKIKNKISPPLIVRGTGGHLAIFHCVTTNANCINTLFSLLTPTTPTPPPNVLHFFREKP